MRRIARASAALPNIVLGGTMRVRRMFVPNFAKEVDAIRAREERCCDRVDRRVAPTLPFVNNPNRERFLVQFEGEGVRIWRALQYLVVEAATPIEVLEERGVGFAAPEVQIGNLKIAPNYLTAPPPQ